MKEIQHTTKQTQHVVDVPNLVELQLDSYRWFLEEGLRELFESFSPITDFTGNHSIELVDYSLGEPKYDITECRARDATLESPIKAKVRLRSATGDVIESDVYLGDLPLMTDKGTFLVNGAERVVVSQLARSSGIYFKDNLDLSGRQLYNATLIPNEGAWIDIETDANDVITVRIGQTRKFPITTLLRALNLFPQATPSGAIKVTYKELPGKKLAQDIVDQETGEVLLESETVMTTREMRLIEKAALPTEFLVELPATLADTNADILTLFGEPETVENPSRETLYLDTRTDIEILTFDESGEPLRKNGGAYDSARPRKRIPYALNDIKDKNGKTLVAAYTKIDREAARKIEGLGIDSLEVLYVYSYVSATIDVDSNVISKESALIDIYKKIRPSDPATPESASSLMKSIFFDMRRYDLAKVGRHKLNKKLGLSLPLSARNITREDVVAIIRYIIRLAQSDPDATVDDIDHLENKRVRSVGELLYSQLRLGFLRMEKVAKERMTSMDTDNILPQVVLSVKPISASIKSFFGSSQLSQFMDQTNPLAELGHKRRLSALGPGGLSRQSAKLEVRDVHHSHYGRICPIETPEGPNIGLIGQLTVHARVDEFGFIETPYRRVIDGIVQDDIDWLPADGEHNYKIAPANARLTEGNRFADDPVQVRHQNEYPLFPATEIDYMDVAPQQLVSVATAIIPFLENDDANRALMGANMQRQAVPTLRPDAPLVKTGMEKRAARDSGAVIVAERDGTVVRVTAEEIIVLTDNEEADKYRLLNMIRSNQATCITQRPIVNLNQRVRMGDVLADGPCTDGGELALGQNILVAFVPWNGYNFEDAILLSQRLVKDDVYTSIHIEKYEVEARDTKLGPEEITRDIPNVGEDALKDLDENGIIRIGAEVRPEDILVGRVAPKGQSELTAEERLIIAIFGKKAEETRDVSLRVPHGEKGKIVDVKIFSRYKYKDKSGRIFNFSKRPDTLTSEEWDGDLERLPADELSAGVNMLVRVYIAQKRKIMEGDKMAGRHGNKGVVSRILPEEDMPFLPNGTPVDIVLNPLGVPSRMNIGQVMETHLGLVGKALGCSFVNPIFEGSTESEILSEIQRYADAIRKDLLVRYVNQELNMDMSAKRRDTLPELYGKLTEMIKALPARKREDLARSVAAPPAIELPEDDSLNIDEDSEEEIEVKEIDGYDVAQIIANIDRNVRLRGGINEKTGKFRLRDGLTGDYFHQDVTVGQIYMLKLAHLVDDKIHARSTGPYSLVTQQPLGGKAQFGGQRFGEMEVWALEAYGAAYTLQEILTIKSDDVLGRVKTYEAIVKGEAMLEPGVPESFKILVNELQSLGLKVTVEDEADREIDLKDREDDYEDPRAGMRFGGGAGAGRPSAPAGQGGVDMAKRGFAAAGSLGRKSAAEEAAERE